MRGIFIFVDLMNSLSYTMKRLIPLILIIISGSPFIFSSCNEKESIISNIQQDILMRHKWRHYQTRTVTIDVLTNTVLKDTITRPDGCFTNSLYSFAADSLIKRNLICSSSSGEKEGKWYLKADSTFSGSITLRISYGTGYTLLDVGLPYSKMKLLTETDFQLFEVTNDTYLPVKYHNTLFLQAQN